MAAWTTVFCGFLDDNLRQCNMTKNVTLRDGDKGQMIALRARCCEGAVGAP
jgi:hypothetical protein